MGVQMRFRNPSVMLAVVLVFCAVNLFSYILMLNHPYISHRMASFGWPFDMYAEGGFVTTTKEVIWTGLIGNVVLALYVASVAETAFTAIKIFVSPRLK